MNKSIDMNCEVHSENLIDIFGETFASNPSNFRFRAGDILLIKEIVAHVINIVDGQGKNTGLGRFKYTAKRSRPNFQQNRRRLAPRKNISLNAQHSYNDHHLAQLKTQLFHKIRTHLDECGADQFVEIELLDEHIVDVFLETRTDDNKKEIQKICGTITCVICAEIKATKMKPKRVYYDEYEGFWVTANFEKHLMNIHHLKPPPGHRKKRVSTGKKHAIKFDVSEPLNVGEKTLKSDTLDDNPESNIIVDESIEIVSFEKDDVDSSEKVEDNWLYAQFAQKITEMTIAVLTNGDKEQQMKFNFGKITMSLMVAEIPSDGNCLFGAIAHQLFRHPISSKQHRSATKKLRSEVVEHILDPDNFPSFRFTLQDRLYENKKADEITDMESECKFYVRYILSRDGKWGGYETIRAISEIYRVNVLIFNEEGTCTLHQNHQQKFENTIALAYRIGFIENGEVIRNHYDSVSEMTADDIFTTTDMLTKRMK